MPMCLANLRGGGQAEAGMGKVTKCQNFVEICSFHFGEEKKR